MLLYAYLWRVTHKLLVYPVNIPHTCAVPGCGHNCHAGDGLGIICAAGEGVKAAVCGCYLDVTADTALVFVSNRMHHAADHAGL